MKKLTAAVFLRGFPDFLATPLLSASFDIFIIIQAIGSLIVTTVYKQFVLKRNKLKTLEKFRIKTT